MPGFILRAKQALQRVGIPFANILIIEVKISDFANVHAVLDALFSVVEHGAEVVSAVPGSVVNIDPDGVTRKNDILAENVYFPLLRVDIGREEHLHCGRRRVDDRDAPVFRRGSSGQKCHGDWQYQEYANGHVRSFQ